jgi:hypothetical protein
MLIMLLLILAVLGGLGYSAWKVIGDPPKVPAGTSLPAEE